MKTIALTGGGSAGHVVPHLALLPELKKYFLPGIHRHGRHRKKIARRQRDPLLHHHRAQARARFCPQKSDTPLSSHTQRAGGGTSPGRVRGGTHIFQGRLCGSARGAGRAAKKTARLFTRIGFFAGACHPNHFAAQHRRLHELSRNGFHAEKRHLFRAARAAGTVSRQPRSRAEKIPL